MTITLDLTSETEILLIAYATTQGMSVENYLKSLVENTLATEAEQAQAFYKTATTEEWIDAFVDWANNHVVKAPPLSDEAISRESIYREREDSQL